jgi:TonB family protein
MKNLRYPAKAIADKIGGEVVVLFDIKADGSMANFAIEKGVRADLNAEALRVCKIMPKWLPATLKGQPVFVRYRMPLILYPPVTPAPVAAKPKL